MTIKMLFFLLVNYTHIQTHNLTLSLELIRGGSANGARAHWQQ